MKALITSFNQKLGVNPIVGRMLDAIPGVERVSVENCEVIFLLFIAPECDFVLDADLLERAKKRDVPVIVFDYTETFGPSFILGTDSLMIDSSYFPLHSFVFISRVKAYFKRELLTTHTLPDLTYPVFPCDWTIADQPKTRIDTVEEFDNRPIDIFFSWGYSNESRPRLMGELLRSAGRFGAHFVLTDDDLKRALEEGRKRIFALLHTPHYRRVHISQLFAWQQYAKVSISMFGAGRKCFRHAEASYNCVMAQEAPREVEWSYPWDNGVNCIDLPNICHHKGSLDGEELAIDYLWANLRDHQGSLYPIYIRGMENNQRYHNTAYARDFLLPKIDEAME